MRTASGEVAPRQPLPILVMMQADLFGSHDPLAALKASVAPFDSSDRFVLAHGNSLELLEFVPPSSIDVIFADPPYFLSNGGTTCRSGQRVSVDKGSWDQSQGLEADHDFHMRWLDACRRRLTQSGTIWVSGTAHVIFSVGYAMQQLGFKILNDVTWEKPNPPPNLGCRCLTHSKETLIWAARDEHSDHFFDYAGARDRNKGKQLKDVWRMQAPQRSETCWGKHPTQKPERLLDRVLRMSCRPGARVLDPFNGSGTSGVVAVRLGHEYIGMDDDRSHLWTSSRRLRSELGLAMLEEPGPHWVAERAVQPRLF